MRRLPGFKPEYYSRNGMTCFDVTCGEVPGTVNLIMVDRFKVYGVWIGAHAETGETNQPGLTRFFKRKADALRYAKQFRAKAGAA
jgi:hypothetical protein